MPTTDSTLRAAGATVLLFLMPVLCTAWATHWQPLSFWTLLCTLPQYAAFVAFQLLLYVVLPGEVYLGPPDPETNQRLSYRDNGDVALVVTYLAYSVLLLCDVVAPDHAARMWSAWVVWGVVTGLFVCAWLHWRAGNRASDVVLFFVGTELHPVVSGVDVKFFIACRVGMMAWAVIALSAASVCQNVGTILQLMYLARFYMWESQYAHTMDQQHDRAGFYIVWGCMAVVPAFYAFSPVAAMEQGLGFCAWDALWLLVGVPSLLLLDDIDRQKQRVRAHPESAVVWGKKATYIKTATGSVLLTCGGWGVARHLHYVFELLVALSWCAPVGGFAYVYVAYLTVLLTDRCRRDDTRCQQKYGDAWKQYCAVVPWKMVPYVY